MDVNFVMVLKIILVIKVLTENIIFGTGLSFMLSFSSVP